MEAHPAQTFFVLHVGIRQSPKFDSERLVLGYKMCCGLLQDHSLPPQML